MNAKVQISLNGAHAITAPEPLLSAAAAAATLQVLLQCLPGGALEVAQGAVQGTEQGSSSSRNVVLWNQGRI
jgi:hypothetical protein